MMTDEELTALVERLEFGSTTVFLSGRTIDEPPTEKERLAASAIRQLMEDLKQARIAGAWLYGLEVERPSDYAEQKPLALHACRLAFRHPQELS